METLASSSPPPEGESSPSPPPPPPVEEIEMETEAEATGTASSSQPDQEEPSTAAVGDQDGEDQDGDAIMDEEEEQEEDEEEDVKPSEETPATTTNDENVENTNTNTNSIETNQQVVVPTTTMAKTKKPKRKKSRRNKSNSNGHGNSNSNKRQHKIFSDTISVIIPIGVTADLKIAIQRTRIKRIQSIYKRFPSLQKQKQQLNGGEDREDNMPIVDEDDEGGETSNKDKDKDSKEKEKPPQKKKKKLAHVPQPSQYGSVLDYLEAKYVRGVQLGDDEDEIIGGTGGGADGANNSAMMGDDGSEGQGSVYSKGSFLDDTDLQRDVAEQVMANTTMTKLELEEDDADFFVNVGTLEVEDDHYGEHYDPLQDKEQTTTKKRKKSQGSTASGVTPANKKKKGKVAADEPGSAKSKKSVSSGTSQKGKKKLPKAAPTPAEKELAKVAKKAKSRADGLLKKVTNLIKKMGDDEMPRRRTKLKVALTCPPNKKPGDDITFTNPHNPGQRLRVKVPKDCFAGGTFKVSVPVKQPAEAEKDGADHNKFPRIFQELIDDYARSYDDWCTAQSEVDSKFALYKEKQGKFDILIKQFPTSLLTPVDTNYMKKIVRRARQNRHKRSKTAAAKGESPSKDDGSDEEPEEEEEPPPPPPPKGREVEIPTIGTDFATLQWNQEDFAMDGVVSPLRGVKETKEAPPPKTEAPKAKGRRVDIPTKGTQFSTKKWDVQDFD